MESEERTGPVADAPVVVAAMTGEVTPTGPSAPAIFGSLFAALLLSVGASALLLAGAGRTVVAEPSIISAVGTEPARATSAPAAGAPSDRVRVVSASGRSTSAGAGSYRISFTWTLEGARENDQAVVHFFVGNQFLGEQRGTLDASVFSFSSGALTLTTEQECSPSGWSAEIVTIRGVPIDGDSIATVPGVQCQ